MNLREKYRQVSEYAGAMMRDIHRYRTALVEIEVMLKTIPVSDRTPLEQETINLARGALRNWKGV